MHLLFLPELGLGPLPTNTAYDLTDEAKGAEEKGRHRLIDIWIDVWFYLAKTYYLKDNGCC